mmetsp:Transcript_29829/g.95021  ORF Transcript_29829/g.95021 Transcript_29829/m.95021 type:complete len:201 (+) Transcript_29829:312-914(+)
MRHPQTRRSYPQRPAPHGRNPRAQVQHRPPPEPARAKVRIGASAAAPTDRGQGLRRHGLVHRARPGRLHAAVGDGLPGFGRQKVEHAAVHRGAAQREERAAGCVRHQRHVRYSPQRNLPWAAAHGCLLLRLPSLHRHLQVRWRHPRPGHLHPRSRNRRRPAIFTAPFTAVGRVWSAAAAGWGAGRGGRAGQPGPDLLARQ